MRLSSHSSHCSNTISFTVMWADVPLSNSLFSKSHSPPSYLLFTLFTIISACLSYIIILLWPCTCWSVHVVWLPVHCKNSVSFCCCNHWEPLCMESKMSLYFTYSIQRGWNCTEGEQVRQAALFIESRTCLYLTWRRALPSVNIQCASKPCHCSEDSQTVDVMCSFYAVKLCMC